MKVVYKVCTNLLIVAMVVVVEKRQNTISSEMENTVIFKLSYINK